MCEGRILDQSRKYIEGAVGDEDTEDDDVDDEEGDEDDARSAVVVVSSDDQVSGSEFDHGAIYIGIDESGTEEEEEEGEEEEGEEEEEEEEFEADSNAEGNNVRKRMVVADGGEAYAVPRKRRIVCSDDEVEVRNDRSPKPVDDQPPRSLLMVPFEVLVIHVVSFLDPLKTDVVCFKSSCKKLYREGSISFLVEKYRITKNCAALLSPSPAVGTPLHSGSKAAAHLTALYRLFQRNLPGLVLSCTSLTIERMAERKALMNHTPVLAGETVTYFGGIFVECQDFMKHFAASYSGMLWDVPGSGMLFLPHRRPVEGEPAAQFAICHPVVHRANCAVRTVPNLPFMKLQAIVDIPPGSHLFVNSWGNSTVVPLRCDSKPLEDVLKHSPKGSSSPPPVPR
eukprot:EG_transcript_8211